MAASVVEQAIKADPAILVSDLPIEGLTTSGTLSIQTSQELEPNVLYAILTYRGDLASWDWAFYVANPEVKPIGSKGTLFHVVNASDAADDWKLEVRSCPVITSPLVVAIIRLCDLGELGTYEEVVGPDSLLLMMKTVTIPPKGAAALNGRPPEFSSRTWFLDAICVLHDCCVVNCDDVWMLEREIRNFGFNAMDGYLQNQGWTSYISERCS